MRLCGKPSCKNRPRRNALTTDWVDEPEQQLWTDLGVRSGGVIGLGHRNERNLNRPPRPQPVPV